MPLLYLAGVLLCLSLFIKCYSTRVEIFNVVSLSWEILALNMSLALDIFSFTLSWWPLGTRVLKYIFEGIWIIDIVYSLCFSETLHGLFRIVMWFICSLPLLFRHLHFCNIPFFLIDGIGVHHASRTKGGYLCYLGRPCNFGNCFYLCSWR